MNENEPSIENAAQTAEILAAILKRADEICDKIDELLPSIASAAKESTNAAASANESLAVSETCFDKCRRVRLDNCCSMMQNTFRYGADVVKMETRGEASKGVRKRDLSDDEQ